MTMKMKNTLKKTAAAVTAMALLIQTAGADVATDMNSFYASVGGGSSFSGAALYQGQSANYFSGGGFSARAPIRNFNLVSVQAPSIRAGCGGIDLFAGGFSFINATQLITMLKNIGSSALGYAFKLAIDTISPKIGGVLDQMQTYAAAINNQSINTCQAGMELVKGTLMVTGAQQSMCEKMANSSGKAKDAAEARFLCQDQTYANSILGQANAGTLTGGTVSAAEQQKAAASVIGNVVWQGMMDDAYLKADKEFARMLMSITGTVVLPKPAASGGAPEPNPWPQIVSFRTLLNASAGVKEKIYKCLDNDVECMVLDHEDVDLGNIRKQVQQDLAAVVSKIATDTGSTTVTLTASQEALLARTGLPVAQLIQVAADINGDLAGAIVMPYSEAIVADMLYSYMKSATDIARAALQRSNAGSQDWRESLTAQMNAAVAEAQAERNTRINQAGGMADVIEKIMLLQRKLAASFSPTMQQRLAFAKMLDTR
ncbi:MAG: conjugal transfer protein TraH [Pseudomonadota bacterium]